MRFLSKIKITALLLTVVMAVSLVLSEVCGFSLFSGNDDIAKALEDINVSESANAAEAGNTSGMVYNKTAINNGDGTYTVILETYATGSKVITEVTEDIPTDIILVLDQSGSMEYDMSATTDDTYVYYGDAPNSEHYDNQNNLYYKLSDGSYAKVNVTRAENGYEIYYQPCNPNWYWSRRDFLYAKVDGSYIKVRVTREYVLLSGYTYTFYLEDGHNTKIAEGTLDGLSFNGIDDSFLYVREEFAGYIYTYTYTDSDSQIKTLTSSGTYVESHFEFYKFIRRGTTLTRQEALKNALNTFNASVNKKAAGADGVFGTEDDIQHRIAVVGYASESGYGNNTELLSAAGSNSAIADTPYTVGIQYSSGLTAQNYQDVLQDITTSAGRTLVNNAILALDVEGATKADLGMKMAQNIIENNPIPEGQKRNRVVIMFTDGSPTSGSSFEISVAEAAISTANTIKNAGIPVYSVGVFDGADVNSAGNRNGNEAAKCNWFMQNLSSNNGNVQTPSYYLSASGADTLNNIFQQISSDIEWGGSETTLSSETVIRDVIPPAFTLPEGAEAGSIKLETYRCTGEANGAYTWENNNDPMGAEAELISTDLSNELTTNNQVKVTGFDFAEHYVGTVTENEETEYRGHKLVISFNVNKREGFLGGNGVYTNAEAGIYENEAASEPIIVYDRPTVDVAIEDVVSSVGEANVYLGAYLLEKVTLEDLKRNVLAVKVGNVELNLTQENFGLEAWQNEYVNITITLKDENGNDIDSFDNLTEDVKYSIEVKVTPKNEGIQAPKTSSSTGIINVFKPEVSYFDSKVYYGDSAIENLDSNRAASVWKHGENTSTDDNVLMLGTEPSLSYSYSYINGDVIYNGYYNTTEDIPVKVQVTETLYNNAVQDITQYVSFKHTDCQNDCNWNNTGINANGSPVFLLHIKTCSVTITKKVVDNKAYDGQKFLFSITGTTNIPFELIDTAALENNQSITITGLPVGTYTVTEDESWSWRYTAEESEKTVTAAKDNNAISVIIENKRIKDKWLDTDAFAQNIFSDNGVYAFKKNESGTSVEARG